MKQTEFIKLLRNVIREEVAKQLPKVVTEVYLKKIVLENINLGDSSSSNQFEDYDEDDVPKVLKNSNKGIYNSSDTFKRKNESKDIVKKIISEKNKDFFDPNKNPFLSMYEDVDVNVENNPIPGEVPLEAFDFKRISENFKAVSQNSAPMAQTVAAKQREIEERRRKLDEMYVDTSNEKKEY